MNSTDIVVKTAVGTEELKSRSRKLPQRPRSCDACARPNIIENLNGIVRRTSRRVTRYRDADMALRWTAAGFLEAQKSFRKIQGVKDLWILEAALGQPAEQAHIANR